jgi:hypothetical protein
MPTSTFSTNEGVNLEFCIHAAFRSLDCPMQEMVTLGLKVRVTRGAGYLHVCSAVRVEYILR